MYVRLAFERSEQQCSMSVVTVVERCRCAILERGGFKLTPQCLIQVRTSEGLWSYPSRKTESGAAIKFGRLVLHCSPTISSFIHSLKQQPVVITKPPMASKAKDTLVKLPSGSTLTMIDHLPPQSEISRSSPSHSRRKGCHDGRNLEKGSWSISGDASASR